MPALTFPGVVAQPKTCEVAQPSNIKDVLAQFSDAEIFAEASRRAKKGVAILDSMLGNHTVYDGPNRIVYDGLVTAVSVTIK